jgi:hypothetical protein
MIAVFLSVNAYAETSYATVSGKNFICSSFSSDNATLTENENGQLMINFSRTAPVVSADVEASESKREVNAIRLALTNNSACNTVLFNYHYLDSRGRTKSQVEKISLGSRGTRTDYCVYIDVPDRITHISLKFSGISSGSMIIHCLDFLSIYNNENDVCGTIDDCVYDQDKDKIVISGTMKYDIVTSCRNARLVLYGMSLDSVSFPYGSIPLASLPMSSHFEFSVSDISIDKRLRSYMVAVMGEGGELLYTFAPRVPSTSADMAEDGQFYKGVNTNLGSASARANASLAIVEVDLDKLVSPNVGEGLLYACNGQYYYFNRQYISMLDGKIQRYYENGMRVALRLYSSKTEGQKELPDVVAVSDQQRLCLYAYTEFLCARYSSSARGVISELIFGEVADRWSSEEMTLEEYTRLYVDSLFIVHEASMIADGGIRIRVPISDFLEVGENLDVRCSPRVFLTSLGKALEERYAGVMNIDVLVEGSLLSGSGKADEQLGFENIREMSVFLTSLSGEYPMISDRYLYCWVPKSADNKPLLSASLVHGYYALAHEKNAEGFIMSSAHISDLAVVSELLDVLQYVDSMLGTDDAVSALTVLGKRSFNELIEGFSQNKIYTVTYQMTSNAFDAPFRFVGDCYLWDFSGLANDRGWIAGEGCLSVVMEKNVQTERALAVRMLPAAEHNFESELIYRYDEPRSFASVDAVSFDVQVDAPKGRYRITVQICGENAVAEASIEIDSGRRTVMYLNTSGVFDGRENYCIRIFTSPIDGGPEEYKLSIGSISAHSTLQIQKLLEQSIEADVSLDVQEETVAGPKVVLGYVIAVWFLVSVVILVIVHSRNEDEK